MKDQLFSISDINDDLIHYIDKYLKKVIIHAKHHYYREISKTKKYGIVFVNSDTLTDNLVYEDVGFDVVLCQYIEVNDIQIPVYNSDLANALLELTEIQRYVLIQNVVLGVTLKQIAYDLKISERMVRKHKHNAIESIRRRMKKSYAI